MKTSGRREERENLQRERPMYPGLCFVHDSDVFYGKTLENIKYIMYKLFQHCVLFMITKRMNTHNDTFCIQSSNVWLLFLIIL